MQQGGFVQDGQKQVYKGMHIFPVEYFCPRQTTGEILITENTYCDHHFMGTWNGKKGKNWLTSVFGPKWSVVLIKMKRKIFG